MKRCDADEHYYDETIHSECPYCGKTSSQEGRDPSEATKLVPEKKENASSDKTRVIYAPSTRENDDISTPDTPFTVGWLVIIDGPGKGHDLRITAGLNSIGRDQDMKISIDFGDKHISRKDHAALIFDPKNNIFFIKDGHGTNLTYLNGAPVLESTRIHSNDKIELGNTTLMFIPLCSDQFNWESPSL